MRGSERFTQRASTAIRKAHDAAAGMGHSYVGTEHILLGIIREGEGLGARILADNALTDSVLTRMVTETVGRGVPGTPEQGLSPRARHVIELAAEDCAKIDALNAWKRTGRDPDHPEGFIYRVLD